MSSVSEVIVREYLESLGFLVRQPRKYAVARAKRREEEIDFLALNPRAARHTISKDMVWTSAELRKVSRVIVGVRGWHTERFTPAVLEEAPEIYRFADKSLDTHATEYLGSGPVAKVLCLPELPASSQLKDKTLGLLRKHGIDGVLLFRGMLLELAASVEKNKSYEKSDLLQVLRILKNYDLLRDAQMELFRGRKKKRG